MAISSVALNMLSVQVNNSLASQSPDESETGDSSLITPLIVILCQCLNRQ
jgi:hypothetical protein